MAFAIARVIDGRPDSAYAVLDAQLTISIWEGQKCEENGYHDLGYLLFLNVISGGQRATKRTRAPRPRNAV